jgi:hypothetical protein
VTGVAGDVYKSRKRYFQPQEQVAISLFPQKASEKRILESEIEESQRLEGERAKEAVSAERGAKRKVGKLSIYGEQVTEFQKPADIRRRRELILQKVREGSERVSDVELESISDPEYRKLLRSARVEGEKKIASQIIAKIQSDIKPSDEELSRVTDVSLKKAIEDARKSVVETAVAERVESLVQKIRTGKMAISDKEISKYDVSQQKALLAARDVAVAQGIYPAEAVEVVKIAGAQAVVGIGTKVQALVGRIGETPGQKQARLEAEEAAHSAELRRAETARGEAAGEFAPYDPFAVENAGIFDPLGSFGGTKLAGFEDGAAAEEARDEQVFGYSNHLKKEIRSLWNDRGSVVSEDIDAIFNKGRQQFESGNREGLLREITQLESVKNALKDRFRILEQTRFKVLQGQNKDELVEKHDRSSDGFSVLGDLFGGGAGDVLADQTGKMNSMLGDVQKKINKADARLFNLKQKRVRLDEVAKVESAHVPKDVEVFEEQRRSSYFPKVSNPLFDGGNPFVGGRGLK